MRLITDEDGTVLKRYNYTAFGSVLSDSGSFDNDYRYTSQAIDEDDLYYMHARFYDNSIGRFTSCDPANSGHSYNYTLSNPVNFTDPMGLMYDYTQTLITYKELNPLAKWHMGIYGPGGALSGSIWKDASNQHGLWGQYDDPFEYFAVSGALLMLREYNYELGSLMNVLMENNQFFINFGPFNFGGEGDVGAGLGSHININQMFLFSPLELATIIYKEGYSNFNQKSEYCVETFGSYADMMISIETEVHEKMAEVWRKIGGYGRDRLVQGLKPINNEFDTIYDLANGIKQDINGEYYPWNNLKGYIDWKYRRSYE